MTIDTKQDAIVAIEYLTDKVRQKKISWGVHTTYGYTLKYNIAVGWGGNDPAPQSIQDLANYKGFSNLEAKQHILDKMANMQKLFRLSDVLKYNAKKEISSLPDTATNLEVRAVYKKHLVIFEAAMVG